ncbi:MAG TPA: 4-(cytidine 5'-diphospho)-2-C-methyl-D-erythritol kinase [Candidatus Limnocylindrales bacterium]|nr:4-(cytidine 5'-diphospho)-2-C-methyl-D-erythritol kinase [Candidatus Limnocylindrales bacterium]
MKRSVRLPAFAKVNFCLHVVGKLPGGYHELRTIFQSISLHDTVELALSSRNEIVLETDNPSLPADSTNLVWRAIDALRHELRLGQGVHARLTKRIPVARGLGGGSSDAAAALTGLLRLTRHELPLPRLIEIAAALGADVPFFLFGGRALGIHRGDEIYPLPDIPRRTILVVSPHGIGVSTRDAYAWIDRLPARQLTKSGSTHTIYGLCALCWSRQQCGIPNAFEAAVFRRHPRLAQIKRTLLRGGAAEAALAGSGSAVFGVFRNPAQARRVAREFSKDQVFVARTLSREDYRRAMLQRVPGR